MYMLQLMDAYAASYSVLFVAFTECVALSWVYGKPDKHFIDTLLFTHHAVAWITKANLIKIHILQGFSNMCQPIRSLV